LYNNKIYTQLYNLEYNIYKLKKITYYMDIQDNSSVDNKDWRVLEFYVPIEESVHSESEDFFIKGVAINETTTLNNVKYVAEELQKAAPSFRNVPILLDHRNEVKNIVGRTTENVNWSSTFNRIDFEAKIMDKGIIEMIKDGRIGSVSIGAKVDDLTEEKDGSMKAIGIRGLELSLVAVPGDNQANLAQALEQCHHLKEMANTKVEVKGADKQLNTNEDTMVEDIKQPEVVPEESKVEVPEVETPEVAKEEEAKEEVVAEEKAPINVKIDTSEISDMKAQIAELKTLLVEKKKITEEIEVEKEETKEDETKGEVSEEKEEALEKVNSLIVEKARSGFGVYRDYSNENSDSNLKRLVR